MTVVEFRVDWFRLIEGLQAASMSLRHVEDVTGISKSALSRYRNGAAPTHADGERLIALWCEATGSWRDGVPKLVDPGANVPASGRGLR